MNEEQKREDLIYGLLREQQNKRVIEKLFNLKLSKTRYKYSNFDFIDDTKTFIVELKNYRYTYERNKYVVIGVIKGVSDNGIFVFRHEDDDEKMYYIQYNKELFDTFNQRYIWYRGRADLCFDIPKEHVIKLDLTKTYTITNYEHEKDNIKRLIEEDKQNYLRVKKEMQKTN